jgi:hypothetical protein
LIISSLSRILFAAYFLEAGFVLIVAPWKAAFWDHNFFIDRLPFFETVLGNVFVRGAVSGIGGLTALAGLAELASLFGARAGGEKTAEHTQP